MCFQKIVVPLHPLRRNDRGVEQLVARQAHNLEVACSSPASATNNLEGALFIGASCVKVPQYSDKYGHGTDNSINFLAGESHLSQEKKMAYSLENTSPACIIRTFTLPQLYKGKQWYVGFTAYDPVTNRLKRKKYMLDRIKLAGDRKRYATLLIRRISDALMNGWNPFIHAETTRQMVPIRKVLEIYGVYLDAMEHQKAMKPKTVYDYKSRLGALETYLDECQPEVKFIYQFDQGFCIDYLDYLILDKDVSARTRNNHRTWLSTFSSWLIDRKYIEKNPVENIKQLREDEKKRDALTPEALAHMRVYLYKYNRPFLLACMMEYYTFIRPDELRHIRLRDISIERMEITVPASVSKNGRERTVGLNGKLIKLMYELNVFSHGNHEYLFSWKFLPGEDITYLNAFRFEWRKMRRALKWPDSYQFYSLKDSGIRDLANAEGVVVARDQAGHSDIAVTNKYLKRGKIVPECVKHFDGKL